ncbi:hypothetical protein [Asanoa ishikariensis]|uniref:hypothetical protein n=1 Tax=Asanoa ishikariensis TaxID=137265 RepID=UPI0015A19B4F|nr:hypothetical protein [Asanoa ishikariensis]
MTGLATAVAATGDYDRAEQIVRSISNPNVQAEALADLAAVVNPERNRTLIADAFTLGRWTIPLQALAWIDPTTIQTFADEFE